MSNYEVFINGIHQKQKVRICYFSQKENKNVYRNCAPLDYGPRRKPKALNCSDYVDDGADKYHFYDYDGSSGGHPASKNPSEIINIETIGEEFNPTSVVDINSKKCPWHIHRDWGIYS